MRPTKQAPLFRAIQCGVLLGVLLVYTVMPGLAAKPTKRQLTHKRAVLHSNIVKVQQRLRKIKVQEQQTRQELLSVRHQVRVARGQLREANLRLQRAQLQLSDANQALHTVQQNFTQTQQLVGTRMVAAYERGDSNGYLDFLLSARDFSDMLERIELVRFLRDQDKAALEDLKARRDQVAGYRQRVQGKTQEVATWQQQVSLLHQRAQVRHYAVARDLSHVRDQRADYEAEYAALMRDSAEITSMLRRMQHTTSGRRRYNRQYTGAVGGLPVNGRITSPFGWRIHPITHQRRLHTGLDIAASIGTPVGAGGGGEVIYAGRRGGYGNTIMIDHGRGRTTLYGHLSAINVRVGQVVSRGQTIGRVGTTGFSTGPHLHYEVRINGSPVNPL